jgi:hypothetical protein
MLLASKLQLETQLSQSALQIENRELQFFNANLGGMAKRCAMLSGFAFKAYRKTEFEGVYGESVELKMLFKGCCGMAMSCHLCGCLIAVITMVMGPGLALRGPVGSITRAVEQMRIERRAVILFFGIGIFFFFFAAALYSWLAYADREAAIAVSIIVGTFMLIFFGMWYRIVTRFKIKDSEKVRGSFVQRRQGKVN